ncbi:NUDIX domain-containing protein [Paenactinomyces guangxiensis]|uniref:NUDIX domain-containing protein n=1 Tax=Paenactinomyces guangxiensis TaxID=1490290 RepID=A0A7W2A964_9BACL|nr:NUDIX domain-containing protein [Paenactinomyces guangxiensis]MBA4495395.1 NUDIX domain-containing protein [Paenactinomyces guangxiensis]MBH8592484.1 NUDIX domain-containing protein [Paenactinomyces guangxiensis]
MSIRWEDSYIGKLRRLVEHHPLIVPSIRAIIQDEQGRVLFLKGEGWKMPAGSIELGESIYDTLKREVKEETGLDVISATLIAIYTSKPIITNRFGDQYQMFEFLFRVDEWSGTLLTETDETTEAKFLHIDERPVDRNGYWGEHFTEIFEDLKSYNGCLILK